MGQVTSKLRSPRTHLFDSTALWIYNLAFSFFFFFFSLEKYNPPANLTVSYNGSHHVVRWDNPETRFDISSHILCYELDFQIKVGTLNLCEEPQIDCVLCFLPVAVEFSLRDGMLLQKVLPRWSFTLSLL